MRRRQRVSFGVVGAAILFAVAVVAALPGAGHSQEAVQEGVHLETGPGDDVIEAVSEPPARDVISCGAGEDVVEADPIDEVAADCETVERFDDPADASALDGGGVSTQAFRCDLTVQDPHKSGNQMVAKGRLACRTDRNRIYLVTELSKWRIIGWVHLKAVENRNDRPRPAANTNLRWNCQSNDDFWFKNYTHGVVRYGSNQKEYFGTNISNRKWRC